MCNCGLKLDQLASQSKENKVTLKEWAQESLTLVNKLMETGEYADPIQRLTENEDLSAFAKLLLLRGEPLTFSNKGKYGKDLLMSTAADPISFCAELTENQELIDTLIDIGIIDKVNESNQTYWTAPLLRDLVMRHLYPIKIVTRDQPPLREDQSIDFEVLLRKALCLLTPEIILSGYVQNVASPSEHVFQAELYAAFCGLLASTTYSTYPEARDMDKKLGRQRLDILLANSTKIVIELKVNAITPNEIAKGVKQAWRYGKALEASQTILLNFVPATSLLPNNFNILFPQRYQDVRTIHVVFDQKFSEVELRYAVANSMFSEILKLCE